MCQACRALVEASANPCPMCGKESVPPLRARASAAVGSSSFISLIILSINLLLFVLMAIVEVNNGRGADAFIQSPSGAVLYDFGGLYPPAVTAGQWWRLVTYNFLHIGLMHLLFNSSALYQIGPQVEELYGSQKFIFLYMLTGVTSAVASYFFNIGGAGASGAIFGLIGLMAVYGYKLGGTYGKAIMRQMLIWGAIGFMFGIMIGANNVAHASGFIAGAGLGFVVNPDAPATNRAVVSWNAVAIICILVLASSFALAGKGYGELQEREFQTRNVILLSNHVRDGKKAWDESISAPGQKQDMHQVAERLKGIASDIDRIPPIDQPSAEISKRLVEIFNKRAGIIDAAGKDEKALVQTDIADSVEADKAFDDYFRWEDSVLEKYGLVRGKR
ncbi:MAG: rhomboid family intramembrane serine protease [Blastocatellia bacterium]